MKILTKITLALLVVAGLILSGCGTSDKFAGSWYYYDKINRKIVEMRIEKVEGAGKYTTQDIFHKYLLKDKFVEKRGVQDVVDLIYTWGNSKEDPVNLTMNKAGELEYDGWQGLAKLVIKEDGKLYLETTSYERWTKEKYNHHKAMIQEQLKHYRPNGYDVFGTWAPQSLIKRVRNMSFVEPQK